MFAFKAKGPVKFYSYGEVTEGNAGDWVIAGEDGDVFVVSNAEFTQTYVVPAVRCRAGAVHS